MAMDRTVFEAAASGDESLIQRLQQHGVDPHKVTPQMNTILHIAVRFNQTGISKGVLRLCPWQLHQANADGNSPLHIAAKIGSEEMVKLLICGLEDIESKQADTIRMKSLKEKDTALHVAIKNASMFEYQAPDLSLEKFRRLLSGFLLHAGDQCTNIGCRKTYQPTQIDIMRVLLEKGGHGLAEEKDVFGWTPFHCAAHLGHLKATQLLLHHSPTRIAYFRDNEGMSALHIAARQGHVNVMEEIIGHNPDASDLVDNRGWTPLHAAIANERFNVVRYILKKPMLENLINAADNEGNTPLHVAAGRDKYSIITILVNDLRVHKKAQNLNFQKPIDLIRKNPNIGELYKSMIAKKLDSQGGRPSLQSLVHGMDIHDREVGHENKEMKSHRLKNISNIHLLVASLIATVTFTAGFTVPGGYEQDQSSTKGLAMLSNKTSFKVFVIADSIAFYCSSTSVFIQFCGSLEHNYHLLLRFTRVAATLTYISSLGMALAFTSAMHAVMPDSTMLAYYTFISGICGIFVYIFGFL